MQRVAHVLFTFKIFLAFRVCCCFMAAPTRQNDLYVRRGNNIYTNKHTHSRTHTLSGGAYAKRRKVCRTFVWACIEVKCCCLSCPLCCLAASVACGNCAFPLAKCKCHFTRTSGPASSKQQQQQQKQKLQQQQQVKNTTCNRIRQTFLLIRKSIAKSHLADDFSY